MGPLQVNKIEHFGSSRNQIKSIVKGPGPLISHFGIIKTPTRLSKNIKNQEQPKDRLIGQKYQDSTTFLAHTNHRWLFEKYF